MVPVYLLRTNSLLRLYFLFNKTDVFAVSVTLQIKLNITSFLLSDDTHQAFSSIIWRCLIRSENAFSFHFPHLL